MGCAPKAGEGCRPHSGPHTPACMRLWCTLGGEGQWGVGGLGRAWCLGTESFVLPAGSCHARQLQVAPLLATMQSWFAPLPAHTRLSHRARDGAPFDFISCFPSVGGHSAACVQSFRGGGLPLIPVQELWLPSLSRAPTR